MNLFSENLPEINSDAELIELCKKFPDYDAGYLCQGSYGIRTKTKEWMEGLWKEYEPHADPHFLSDFKRQFSQRSWEMYLGNIFINRGYILGQNSGEGPDFHLRVSNGKDPFWVEAISVRPGDGQDKVPEMVYGTATFVPKDSITLRVASALEAKYQKYLKDLDKGIIQASDPYVIAISRSELGYVEFPPSYVLRALFGIGDPQLSFLVPIPGEDPKPKEPEFSYGACFALPKMSGNTVPMTFFLDAKHAGISAVIYNIDDIVNCPRTPSEMGENFMIVHNPNASNPLSSEELPFGEEYNVIGENVVRTREKKSFDKPDVFEDIAS